MVRFHSQVDLIWLDGIFKNKPVEVDDVTKAYSMVSLSDRSIWLYSLLCKAGLSNYFIFRKYMPAPFTKLLHIFLRENSVPDP